MESHDIVRGEKLIESDDLSNKNDVEMKYEINEDQNETNHEKKEEQQQQQLCSNHEEQSREINTNLNLTNHGIHKVEIDPDLSRLEVKFPDYNNEDALSSNKSNELKHVVKQEDEQIKNEEHSDKEKNIAPNINLDEQTYGRDEEMVEKDCDDEDEDEDKLSNAKEKSTQGLDIPEDKLINYDELRSMGRNRRVRQKNRYFLDFHCIDLTKGARSNKDDYEGFTTNNTTGTRSSNRRSTTDSNRGQQDETDGIESRYCRKCSTKTMHDVDGGCQPCLYKKIVESSKRQRPSGQRGRSRHYHTKQQQQQQQQHQHQINNKVESSSNTPHVSKRKANRQGGSKINGNNSNLASINSNINNINNTNNTDTNAVLDNTNKSPITNDETIVDAKKDTSVDKLPRLDSWTPDEVAEYILSKGFTKEAELFKMQSVDGISLLLMQRTDFTYGLRIKLGPALKIYDQVCKLKKEYFSSVAATN